MNNHSRGIALEGEYDLADRGALATLFGALSPDGPATIDMTKVTYLDATMLTELLKLQTRFKEHSIKLLVRSHIIRRVLRIVRFEQLFEIVDA
jgi:anti-anti-sigma regulatory factor